MTQEELAALTISNDCYMWGGIILGLLLSGSLKNILNILAYRFERPKRIRFRNMNGRHERKDNFEYLYLYKNEYYTLEQRDFLLKERLKNIKSVSRIDKKFVVLATLFILLMLYSFYLNNQILAMKLGF